MDHIKNIISLYYDVEDYFVRSISKSVLDFGHSTSAYATEVSISYLNPLIIREDIGYLETMFDRSKQFYEASKCPWVIVISDEKNNKDYKNYLKSMGYRRTTKSSAMYLELDEFKPISGVENFIIKDVNNNLQEWARPLTDAFKATLETTGQYVNAHIRALSRNAKFYHFSLYVNDEAVSSVTLSIYQNLARIDDLGTHPNFQGKGYGTYLMNYVLNEAKKSGCVYCFLEASNQGLTLYQKLGFKELFKNNIYTNEKSK